MSTLQEQMHEAIRNLQQLLEIVDPETNWARKTVESDLVRVVLLNLLLLV